MSRFRPLKAESIGLIIHYECTFRCGHCLYACRPGIEEDVRPEELDRLSELLQCGTRMGQQTVARERQMGLRE